MRGVTIALLLLVAAPAAAQPLMFDKYFESHATPTEQKVAGAVSWVTAIAPVVWDGWQSCGAEATRSRRACTLEATRVSLTYVAVTIVKRAVHRSRPCAPNDCGPDVDPQHSFYSAHSALPMTALCGPPTSHVLALSITTGILRGISRNHWATDIIAGLGAGGAVGCLVR